MFSEDDDCVENVEALLHRLDQDYIYLDIFNIKIHSSNRTRSLPKKVNNNSDRSNALSDDNSNSGGNWLIGFSLEDQNW